MPRAVVAMSGGVDSAVAALLLARRGLDVVGVTMHLGTGDGRGGDGACCGADDVDDARRVAAAIGIPFYVVNLAAEFERHVVRPFVAEYLRGRTPSPCILCNEVIKFDLLMRRALGLGADLVATGHYARIAQAGTRLALRRGADKRRDQSYFLFTLSQAKLKHLVFPVGDLGKDEVRAIAREAGLPVADKGDSQEICFVPPGGYAQFVAARAGDADASGAIVDTTGGVMGSHRGFYRYTVGQRRGTGLALGTPRYVARVDASTRQVTIGGPDDLLAGGLSADAARWISGAPPPDGTPCTVRIRNAHRGAAGRVFPSGDTFAVRFDEKVRAVAPGQAAVLYDGDDVLGGGWIRCSIA